MITANQFQKGKQVLYSDFYDKSYAIIELIKITKRRGAHFWFNAKLIDNSHLSNKDLPYNQNGSIHSYSNSFIYEDMQELKKGSAGYIKTQVKAIQQRFV